MSEDEVYALFDSAFEDLEDEEYESALAKAAELRKARFTGALEVEALVHRAQGDLQKALSVLQEAPSQVWALQLLLGSTLCDLARYDEALEVYSRCRALENADIAAVAYNESITLSRLGRWDDVLERVPDGEEELRYPSLGLRVEALGHLQRYGEAAELSERVLAEELSIEQQSTFWLARARYAWKHAADRKPTIDFAIKSLQGDAWNREAMELLREAGGEDSRRYRLMARGRWHTPLEGEEEPPDFFRIFDVEAPTLAEAQSLAVSLEPEAVRSSVTWDKVEDFGPCPSGLGVIHAWGHFFC